MDEVYRLYKKIKDENQTPIRIIKRKHLKASFLKYFFRERRKIARWNLKTNLVLFGLLGARLKVKQDFKRKLVELFLRHVFPIYAYTEEILKEGWRWQILSIREYNMIVLFVDFCKKMYPLEQAAFLRSKDFFKMEESFLILTYKEKYPEIIVKAFKKILITHNKTNSRKLEKMRKLINNLHSFFSFDDFRPSFYNLILGFNMVYYRKYIEWKDLIRSHVVDFIQDKYYDCSPEVFQQLVQYLKKLSKEIEILERKKKWLDWLKRQSKIEDDEEPGEIMRFYERLGYSWYTDRNDIFSLLLSLIKGIIQKLDRMLRKEWVLMTEEEKIVRKKIINNNKLDILLSKLEDEYILASGRCEAIKPSSISYKDYLQSDIPKSLLATENHKYIYDRISRMLSYLFQMAMLIKELTEKESGKNRDDFFLKHMVVGLAEWRGRPVLDVLMFYTALFLQICGYFRNKTIMIELRKLALVNGQLKSKEKEKANLDAGRLITGLQSKIEAEMSVGNG